MNKSIDLKAKNKYNIMDNVTLCKGGGQNKKNKRTAYKIVAESCGFRQHNNGCCAYSCARAFTE